MHADRRADGHAARHVPQVQAAAEPARREVAGLPAEAGMVDGRRVDQRHPGALAGLDDGEPVAVVDGNGIYVGAVTQTILLEHLCNEEAPNA